MLKLEEGQAFTITHGMEAVSLHGEPNPTAPE